MTSPSPVQSNTLVLLLLFHCSSGLSTVVDTCRARGGAEILSIRPRIVLQHGFLTDAEASFSSHPLCTPFSVWFTCCAPCVFQCDDLIRLGRSRLLTSQTVTEQQEGTVEKGAVTEARRSRNTFFEAPDLFTGRHSEATATGRGSLADLLHTVNQKVELLSHYPASHGEMLQLQEYRREGYYEIHHDGDDRAATALIYLSNGTVHPNPNRTVATVNPNRTVANVNPNRSAAGWRDRLSTRAQARPAGPTPPSAVGPRRSIDPKRQYYHIWTYNPRFYSPRRSIDPKRQFQTRPMVRCELDSAAGPASQRLAPPLLLEFSRRKPWLDRLARLLPGAPRLQVGGPEVAPAIPLRATGRGRARIAVAPRYLTAHLPRHPSRGTRIAEGAPR